MNQGNLQKVIDHIEKEMTDDHTDNASREPRAAYDPSRPAVFDMYLWYRFNACGSIACIYGTVLYLMYLEGRIDDTKLNAQYHSTYEPAVEWLGIDHEACDALFVPHDGSRVHDMNSSREHVVQVLKDIRDGRIVFGPWDHSDVKVWHYALTEAPS